MIILPNNCFGMLVMLALICMIEIAAFCVTLWMVGLIAPWWVSVPSALLVAMLTFITIVKFKQ